MKKILNILVKIIGWIALFAALSSFGFASEKPAVAIPIYLIFFLVIFGLVFLYVKKNQKRHESDDATKQILHKVFGVILVVIALFTPTLLLKSANLPVLTYIIITVITAILIVLAIFAISIINKARGNNILATIGGYLLLIVISVVPALGIMQYDSSYNALGMAYYNAVLISIFSWWGISLFTYKEI